MSHPIPPIRPARSWIRRRVPNRRAFGAFTLIELLVVIAIITILAGILIPSVASVRSSARRTKCLTNLRGFGIAFQLYYDQNKERLPKVLPFYDASLPGSPQDPQLLEVLAQYMDAKAPYYDDSGKLIVNEPYLCPGDLGDNVGRRLGISYEYWGGVLMLAREIFRNDPDPARTVTRFYEGNRTFPVLADAQPFHKAVGTTGQNALYFGDWRVDWLVEDPASTIPRTPDLPLPPNPPNPPLPPTPPPP